MTIKSVVGSFLEFFLHRPWLLLLIFVIYCIVWYISIKFNGRKSGPNPFKHDYRQPLRPLVTDKASRKAVIKQVFAVKKVPDKLDAVVIGSGISGLTCAALLSRAGKRVLVLEQHTRAGGATHTFKEMGYEFDVGIHYIGGMHKNTLHKMMLDQLTTGQLQWADMDKEYDMVVLGRGAEERRYGVVSDEKQWRKRMVEYFPDEAEAIDKYMKNLKSFGKSTLGLFIIKMIPLSIAKFLLATRLFRLISSCFTTGSQSTWSYLTKLTNNKDLRAVLCHNYGDLGTSPDESPIIAQSLVDNHYMEGASYPIGGASEIAFHMIPVIERSGGKVLVKAPVSKILLDEKDVAIGVRIEKGGEVFDVHAPMVISACGVSNTYKRLLPRSLADTTEIGKLIGSEIRSGAVAVSLFVGLNASSEELSLKSQNYWVFKSNDLVDDLRNFLSLSASEAVEQDFPFIFGAFPSAKDPSFSKHNPGKSTCTVIAVVKYEWFAEWENERVKHRGGPYENFKDALAQNIWNRMCDLYPQMKNKVEYMELGSPLSNNFYLGVKDGEIYGLDHDIKRFSATAQCLLRPESGVQGLWLTGQDILSAGFIAAFYSGILTTSAILNRNLVNDASAFRKKYFPRPSKHDRGEAAVNGVNGVDCKHDKRD